MNVTVFTKPGCVQCNATYRQLGKSKVGYASIDVTETLEAYEFLDSRGHKQMPVVIVSEEALNPESLDSATILDEWTGFNPDKIKELAETKEPVAA